MSQEALIWLNGLPKGEVRLKPTARRLLECLALHHRHETGCYISQARLANEAVVSRGTVNNCLNILEREGLIARERRGSPARGVMQTTRYHFPFECQSAPNFDPLSAPNIDPLIGWLWSGADGRAGQGCGAIRPAGAGCQIRFLKRQLSLPVSTISQ
ncbi:helix-turn-helix domain-containing protein [Devosia sp. YIM 151766]|uniref:helix-turn-helix domain-containing protein n=1 Tax=Devosia sp. YIM 151766 TaxID=3017325 RepID=UPI003340741B